MFGAGSGGFGGFGQNNQQQQTGTGSVFGGGGAFGGAATNTGTGAFGSGTTGGFGSTTGTGGAFGSANTGTSAFGGGGGFGSTASTGFGAAAKPAFGAPATGGGLFGSSTPAATTSTFGGFGAAQPATTSAFGSTGTTGGGLFGGAAAAKPAGGLFGSATGTTSAFGASATPGAFGTAAAGNNTTMPAQGTATVPYAPHLEKEGNTTTNSSFQTICFMPAYQNFSMEELRLQDYSQGRKFGNGSGQAGAFGFGTGFGGAATATPATTGFGATATPATGGGLFGATNNTATTGGFGSGATNAFGATNNNTGGGLFGAPKPAATGGLFGSTPAATTGGGLFGSTPAAPATNAFGSTTGTGAFGSNTATTGGGLFGSQPQQNQVKTGFGGFGQAQSTPAAGGFGATSTTGAFGSTPATTGGGLFGQTQQQQPAAGAFGATPAATTSAFGGAFGANNQQQQQQTGTSAFGGGFGQTAQQPAKPAFGGFGTATTSSASGTTGGLFGNTQQQPAQQQSGGLFGAKPAFGAAATPATGGGLFGTAQPAQQQQTGGLFGGTNTTQTTGGGLFGGATTGTNTNTGGGLFGASTAKPGGLFGTSTSTTQPSGGLFGGGTGLNTTSNNLGGSLFGNNQQQQPQQQQGGSLFGGSMMGNNQQQQQNFSTSIADSPYSAFGGNPAAQGSQLGPIATPLSGSGTKKAAMIPHHKIAPKQPTFNPRGSGVYSRSGSPFTVSTSGSALGSSVLGRSVGSGSKMSLFDQDDTLLSSGAFTPGGSSRVASLKKLVIDKKLREDNLYGAAEPKTNNIRTPPTPGSATKGILKKSVSFDVNADDDLYSSPASSTRGTPSRDGASAEEMGYVRSTPERRRPRPMDDTPSSVGSQPDTPGSVTGQELALVPKETDNKHGQYYMSPPAHKLETMSHDQLKKVTGFTVGRRGFGQVRFDNPVDLTQLECELRDIPGNAVTFDQRVCTVYPEGMQKPPPGKGLNVPATIMLDDCFPVTKNERGKIRDPEHPRYITHIKRLKSIKDTEFIDYLPDNGVWIFRVQHFTTYGLTESDDEESGYSDANKSVSYDDESDATPRQSTASYVEDDSILSQVSDADVSGMDTTGDDTFDYKQRLPPRAHTPRAPGSFLAQLQQHRKVPQDDGPYSDEDASEIPEESFLGEGSVGSGSDDEEPAEPVTDDEEMSEDSILADDSALIVQDESIVGGVSGVFEDDDDLSVNDDFQATPRGSKSPVKNVIADDWTTQLNNTVSPVKKRQGAESAYGGLPSARKLDFMASGKKLGAEKLSYGFADLQNDLYGTAPSMSSLVGNRKRDFVESPSATSDFGVRPQFARSLREPVAPTAGKKFEFEKLGTQEQEWMKTVRASWDRDGSFVYSGQLDGAPRSFRRDHTGLHVARVDRGNKLANIEGILQIQLGSSAVNISERNIPHFSTDHETLFSALAQGATSEAEAQIWKLASVLWDPIHIEDPEFTRDQRSYLEQKQRKALLTEFLQTLIQPKLEAAKVNANAPEELAIADLTCNNISGACAHLIQNHDLRLATLVSLIGGDDSVRDRLRTQIDTWRGRGVLSEMSIPIRALYELCSGETCFSEGYHDKKVPEDEAPDFYFAQQFNLDWTRVFGLKLWYGLQESDGIARAVEQFEDDVEAHPHALSLPASEFPGAKPGDLNFLYALLKIYASAMTPLDEIFDIAPAEKDRISPRIHWQLYTLLAARELRDVSSPGLASRLHADFAAYLEQLGMWEWSIFVILHEEDEARRVKTVKDILSRNVIPIPSDSANNEEEQIQHKLKFLTDVLHVPSDIVHEALALRARYAGQHTKEADLLLTAGDFVTAHRVIARHVAPAGIISGDLTTLKEALLRFPEEQREGALKREWRTGGQVWEDYMKLLGMTGTSLGAKGKKAEEKKVVIERLVGALRGVELAGKGFEEQVAIREMAGRVVEEAREGGGMMRGRWVRLPLTEERMRAAAVRAGREMWRGRIGVRG